MEITTIELSLITFLKDNILAENVVITVTSEFKEMGVDSYSIVEVVLFVERKFGYVIPDSQLTPTNFENISTVAKLVHSEITKN